MSIDFSKLPLILIVIVMGYSKKAKCVKPHNQYEYNQPNLFSLNK